MTIFDYTSNKATKFQRRERTHERGMKFRISFLSFWHYHPAAPLSNVGAGGSPMSTRPTLARWERGLWYAHYDFNFLLPSHSLYFSPFYPVCNVARTLVGYVVMQIPVAICCPNQLPDLTNTPPSSNYQRSSNNGKAVHTC